MTDRAGKVAVVTGAGRGIGQAVAIRLGMLDVNVVADAGIDETGGPVLDVTEAAYDRMFNVDATGAFFTPTSEETAARTGRLRTGAMVRDAAPRRLAPHALTCLPHIHDPAGPHTPARAAFAHRHPPTSQTGSPG
ncbi:hypothetical protein ACIRL0_12270 [Streptomyces sp. NPDC102365]|uniref:hypothetical protein n=1 Tax=Streptomyces sp. NPDC102365 TaxID=3366162 RepID=UPI003809E964